MKNAIIRWVLPTVRQQGGPLLPGDIKHVVIALSANGGVDFAPVGTFTPDVLEAPANDLAFGDQYVARGWCVDTADKQGEVVDVTFAVTDDSPPGPLQVTIEFP